jgi:hypothetical protein
MYPRSILLIVAVAACSNNPHATGASRADASPAGGGDAADGGLLSGHHTLFLEFDGVTISPGKDDPTMNVSTLVNRTSTVTAYQAGDPSRAMSIARIVGHITTILSPYSINVTTTRPAAGPYDMAVIGGSAPEIGVAAGAVGDYPFACDPMMAPYIYFQFDGFTEERIAANVMGMNAFPRGVPITNKPEDCMCIEDNGCTHNTPCTLGGAGTPIDLANDPCDVGGRTTMDENVEFLRVFGAR